MTLLHRNARRTERFASVKRLSQFPEFCIVFSGAKANVGKGGDSPLHAAVRMDCAEQVLLLLEFGADVNLRDENNQRAVDVAPPGGNTQQLLKTFQGKAVFCRVGAACVMA